MHRSYVVQMEVAWLCDKDLQLRLVELLMVLDVMVMVLVAEVVVVDMEWMVGLKKVVGCGCCCYNGLQGLYFVEEAVGRLHV